MPRQMPQKEKLYDGQIKYVYCYSLALTDAHGLVQGQMSLLLRKTTFYVSVFCSALPEI